jgi:hypothetical protein
MWSEVASYSGRPAEVVGVCVHGAVAGHGSWLIMGTDRSWLDAPGRDAGAAPVALLDERVRFVP